MAEDSDMIQMIYTPKTKEMTLPIPEHYVGTKLEILIFPVNEGALTLESENEKAKPVFGCAKGQFLMADDFDAPLDDFRDYM
jgi:hypothetical protein